jgi:hypothetical protein
LILAFADPLAIFLAPFLDIDNSVIHSTTSILQFYSVIPIIFIKKYLKAGIGIIVLFLILLFTVKNLIFIILFIHSVILYIFLNRVTLSIYKTSELNIFILILIFYEISLIVNFIVFISNTNLGIIFFYLTVSFQILVAIFFTIFRDDSPHLKIKLNVHQ